MANKTWNRETNSEPAVPSSGPELGTTIGADIGKRIAHIRGALSRETLAKHLQSAKNTIANYERGERIPKADFLARLYFMGWNLNWVVTGEGPARLADTKPQQAGDWNPNLLRQVIEAVEAALDLADREMDAPDKAELILSIYELYAESGASPNTAKIIKLVRTTA